MCQKNSSNLKFLLLTIGSTVLILISHDFSVYMQSHFIYNLDVKNKTILVFQKKRTKLYSTRSLQQFSYYYVFSCIIRCIYQSSNGENNWLHIYCEPTSFWSSHAQKPYDSGSVLTTFCFFFLWVIIFMTYTYSDIYHYNIW